MAVSIAAAANTSMYPWNRWPATERSPTANVSTSSVITATAGTTVPDRPSTPKPKSIPARNATLTAGRVTATITDSATTTADTPTDTTAAVRTRAEVSSSAAPASAGRHTSAHNASSATESTGYPDRSVAMSVISAWRSRCSNVATANPIAISTVIAAMITISST